MITDCTHTHSPCQIIYGGSKGGSAPPSTILCYHCFPDKCWANLFFNITIRYSRWQSHCLKCASEACSLILHRFYTSKAQVFSNSSSISPKLKYSKWANASKHAQNQIVHILLIKIKKLLCQHWFSHNKNKVRMDMHCLLPLSSDFTRPNVSRCVVCLICNQTCCCLIFSLASTVTTRPFPAALCAGVNCNLWDCSHKAKHFQLPLARNYLRF